MKALSRFLTEARNKSGLTLRAAEAKSKGTISNGYISQLESGFMNKKPTPEKLKALSLIYEISYEEIMEIAGYIERKRK